MVLGSARMRFIRISTREQINAQQFVWVFIFFVRLRLKQIRLALGRVCSKCVNTIIDPSSSSIFF